MENISWLRQTKDKPLFPDLMWSRPENKRRAGKLLIVGGNLQAFAEVGAAYTAAEKAGIGATRVILPDSLQKTLSRALPEAQFSPSTPSGSFSRSALADLLEAAAWADGILLAGNFGKNSETAILLESFADKYTGQLTVVGDTLDYFLNAAAKLTARPKTVVVATVAQLQKLASPGILIRQRSDLMNMVQQLSGWASKTEIGIITEHSGQIIAASSGKVSTTLSTDINLTHLAAYASVWFLQQPEKPFEAFVTSVFRYCQR